MLRIRLNSASRNALEAPKNQPFDLLVDRFDELINREEAQKRADHEEDLRLKEEVDRGRDELARWDRDVRDRSATVVHDIDENGEIIPRASQGFEGEEHALLSHRRRIERRIEKAEARRQKHQKSRNRGKDSWRSIEEQAAKLLNEILGRNASIEQWTPPKKFTASVKGLEDTRAKVATKSGEVAEVEGADDPLDERLASVDRYVDERASKSPCKASWPNPSIRGASGRRRQGMSVKWTIKGLRGVEPATPDSMPVIEDVEAVALWLAPEKVREELKRQVREAYADGRLALSAGEREKRLKKLRAELHALELEEAAHLWALVEQGEDVVPRRDMSPKALLMIK